jgi:APA family basic amino acid/polyamine antiporter
VARKLPQLQRVLGPRDLFSAAYGEIAASIYLALGIVALHGLGLTPVVLLVMGGVFLLVALSYGEGTAAIAETGGAATLARRAFNDPVAFVVGWALFLDYAIVIGLAGLFSSHYLGAALHASSLRDRPWDIVFGIGVVLAVGSVRLIWSAELYRVGVLLAALDLVAQGLLIVLGLAILFSPDAVGHGIHLGSSPSWSQIAFALPLAMLAYTGLETLANLAEESREPRDLPRSLLLAVGAVVSVYVLIALVALSAFPVENGTTQLGHEWLRSPMVGIVVAFGGHLPSLLVSILRVFIGLTGAMILVLAATTAISGFSRLAYSLGEHGMLPAPFGRLHRRTLVSPWAIVAAAAIAATMLAATSGIHDQVPFLASLFSFGILLSFTIAQLSVIRLRITEPERPRPFRIPLSLSLRSRDVPLPALVGAALTTFVFVLAMITHSAARYGGPVWLLLGLAVYGLVRYSRGAGLLEHVVASDEQVLPEARFGTILVPMKLGDVGEEMLATAIRLAQERNASVIALNVMHVPLDRPLYDPPRDVEEDARASLAEARTLGEDLNVPVREVTVHARSIGTAIVEQARELNADLIVLGSSPRWRRQSRFFSPTVEYVLRRAPCEVIVVTFPEGALESAAEEEEHQPAASDDGAERKPDVAPGLGR